LIYRHDPLRQELPTLFDMHHCKSGVIGVADLIAFVDKRVLVKHGRGWTEKKEKKK